jgi:hypothetical protein
MLGQFDIRFKPELGLAIFSLNVNVHSRLFPRKEIEAKTTFAKNRWTHHGNDTR